MEGIYVVEIRNEDIDAGIARYLSGALSRAEEDNAVLLIKIDTPGGLLESTKNIVEQILNSDTTVMGWVTPRGAYAYSAGTYILMSCDVAAMDDGTSIGAAEPRPSDNKTVQAMISWMGEIAESQGRPGSVAKEFVTKNRTMGPAEALEEKLINIKAVSNREILDYLEISGARTVVLDRDFTSQVLGVLSTPQIAIILLMLGMLGVAAEIVTGGIGVPGIGGAICLLLALLGLMVLEVSALGVLLIVLGAILLAVEVFKPGFGAFGIGGAVMLFLGVLFIGKEPWMQISGTLLKVVALGLIFVFGAFILVMRRAKELEVKTGMESMIGSVGEVIQKIDPDGVVRVRGERWSATSGEEIEEGEEIVIRDITKKRGVTTLVVERAFED